MIEQFKNDYYWMLRESKGYYPWIENYSYRLEKHIFGKYWGRCIRCHGDINPHEIFRIITDNSLFENRLFDLFFKALLRAEIRLISRFIPQRSHEERLTGNFVSEIDNSIFIIKDDFRNISKELYSDTKEIDFIYYDLSRGGKLEKVTGADLGFILVIDLPDYPFTIKSFLFQVKKVYNNSQIDRQQYETLLKYGVNDSAYLFYDMNLETLTCPFVLKADSYHIKNNHQESIKNKNDSFSLKYDDILSDGHPFSLFILTHLLSPNIGRIHSSFENAFNYFDRISFDRDKENIPFDQFNGRLAIASLGKNIRYSVQHNESFRISI